MMIAVITGLIKASQVQISAFNYSVIYVLALLYFTVNRLKNISLKNTVNLMTTSIVRYIEWSGVTQDSLGEFKSIHSALFPVRYDDKYYKLVLASPDDLVRVGRYRGRLIAVLTCRIEPPAVSEAYASLCIMTLGVIPVYQGMGIGSALLAHVLELAENKYENVGQVYLHVHVENEEAIAFYMKHGFHNIQRIVNYYKRNVVHPPDCFLLKYFIARPQTNEASKSETDSNL